MKLVNCKVGTKVVVKSSQEGGTAKSSTVKLGFYTRNVAQLCTITKVPDGDGDVTITVDSDGSADMGHHTNLRKYKGAA